MRFIINLIFFNGLLANVRDFADTVLGNIGLSASQTVQGVLNGNALAGAQDTLSRAIGIQTLLHPAVAPADEFASLNEAMEDADVNPQSLAGLLDISDPGGLQINGVVMQFRNAADALGYPGDSGGDRLADVMIWVAGNAQPPA